LNLKFWTATATLISFAAIPFPAHHSFAAEFYASKAIRLHGTLTKIEWTNPHSYFYVDVKDGKGQIQNWACEGAVSVHFPGEASLCQMAEISTAEHPEMADPAI
jgi:hypothetical protein